jgi:hypothetical protein
VRAKGAFGGIEVYDVLRRERLFELPAGILSADGTRHVTVSAGPHATTIRRYDARTGRLLGASRMPGRWWTNAVSADGGRIVLADLVKGRRTATRLAVLDGTTGRVLRLVKLRGNLEAEAVSKDGRRLFLVQWLHGGYVVRGYDTRERRLATIRAGGDPAVMRGAAWGSVASPDGRWLLTLYLEPGGEIAIHALDIRRGRAACIDLPAAPFEAAREYGFVVAGLVALAVNPKLGVVARIDLAKDRVAAVSRFRRAKEPGAVGIVGAMTGRRAAFAHGGSVWTYDLGSGAVAGPRDAGATLVGLAFTADGKALRGVRADGRVLSLGR